MPHTVDKLCSKGCGNHLGVNNRSGVCSVCQGTYKRPKPLVDLSEPNTLASIAGANLAKAKQRVRGVGLNTAQNLRKFLGGTMRDLRVHGDISDPDTAKAIALCTKTMNDLITTELLSRRLLLLEKKAGVVVSQTVTTRVEGVQAQPLQNANIVNGEIVRSESLLTSTEGALDAKLVQDANERVGQQAQERGQPNAEVDAQALNERGE